MDLGNEVVIHGPGHWSGTRTKPSSYVSWKHKE